MPTMRETLQQTDWYDDGEGFVPDDEVVIGALVGVVALNPETGAERVILASSDGLGQVTQHGLAHLIRDRYASAWMNGTD